MPTYPIHPLCELLPSMTPDEYAGLLESLRPPHGRQTDPVILLDKQVLDGRHRQKGCEELGVECRYMDYPKSWGDPVEWVMRRAIHRNLSASQKAAVAAKFSDELVDAGVERRKGNLRRGTGATSGAADADAIAEANARTVALGRSVDRAALMFGVSPRYVQDARALRMADGKLFDRVFGGNLKLSVAKVEARRNLKRAVHRRAKADAPATAGRWRLVCGDCLAEMAKLPRRFAKLVFADPPYNEGVDYGRGAKADRLPRDEYLAWCGRWLAEAAELLTADGSLWVLISEDYLPELAMLGQQAGLNRRRLIVWAEGFGVYRADDFGRNARFLIQFVRDPANYVFNAEAVRVPSDRQVKYNDARANPAGKILPNVWDVPRVAGTHPERIPDFPTQLPEELLRRVVCCATDPGDVVVDPFNGSGTTGRVAVVNGRDYVGIDVSKTFVRLAHDQLAARGHEDDSTDRLRRP